MKQVLALVNDDSSPKLGTKQNYVYENPFLFIINTRKALALKAWHIVDLCLKQNFESYKCNNKLFTALYHNNFFPQIALPFFKRLKVLMA